MLPKASCDGVVIQRVHFTDTYNELDETFWEYWSIKKGQTEPTPKFDFPEFKLFMKRYPEKGRDALNAMAKHNDFFWYNIPRRKEGSVKFDGKVWYAVGTLPGLPGQKNGGPIPVIPGDDFQFIGGQVYLNDYIMQLWVTAHAKAGPVSHVWSSNWNDKGVTTIAEKKP